jgi:peptide/nickel transport system permease protein
VTAYLLRRVLAVIPVMAVVVTIVFLLIHLIPGDPVSVMLGPDATPAQIQGTRKALGLDRPVHEQLVTFYGRVLRGDLGHSYFLDRPVTTALAERAEPTIVLTLCALLVAVAIGVPSGIVAAAHRGSFWDRSLMFLSLLGVCVPGFWLSLNFIFLFAVRLGWLPAPPSPTWCCPRCRSGSTNPPSSRASPARACSRCCSRTTSAPRAPRGSRPAW